MFKGLSLRPTNERQIARQFPYLGWIGFWFQGILAAIPIIVVSFQGLFSSDRASIGSPDSGNILSFLDILTLLFTIYWCLRYIKLGRKLENFQLDRSLAKVRQQVWIGVANVAVMLLAVSIGLKTVGNLLYLILSMPQASGMIWQTTSGGAVINQSSIVLPIGAFSRDERHFSRINWRYFQLVPTV